MPVLGEVAIGGGGISKELQMTRLTFFFFYEGGGAGEHARPL